MKAFRAGLTAVLCFLMVSPGAAQSPHADVQSGRAIVQTHCARCHSTGRVGPSPLSIAPLFRDLHKLYPVESLEEALAEGIMTGHADMPQFRFEPDEIDNLIAYLKSLE